MRLLGRSGEIQALTKQIGSLPPDQRQKFGKSANALKRKVNDEIEARKTVLQERALAEKLAREKADVTLPCGSVRRSRGAFIRLARSGTR